MQRRSTGVIQRRGIISVSLLLLLLGAALPGRADDIRFLLHTGAGWIDQDLTTLTGAIQARTDTGVTAFYDDPSHKLHVFYQTTDQHVHQLFFNNTSWVDQDLTTLAGGPLALGSGGISAFAIGKQQHVFYLGNDLNVHHLHYDGTKWSDHNPTALAHGPVTDFSTLLAYPTANGHFHVFYLANNSNDLHELNYNGSAWTDLSLKTVVNQEPADRGWVAGFPVGNQQNFFYPAFSPKDKVHLARLLFNGTKWISQDLSAKVHGLPLSLASGITAFPFTNTQLEVYCVTNDLEVHQFTLANGAWTDQDLNNNQPDGAINQMVAFKTPNNHFHLFYPPNDMYQLEFNGTSWSDQDLTTLSGGGIPNGQGGMAGFAIGGVPYVFYVAE